MRKTVIVLFLVYLSLSGCSSLKNSREDYKGQETAGRIAGKDVRKEEKAAANTKQETETKTAGISEKTEFYPPTAENPQGGVPKVIERKIYITDEKVLNKTIKNYEKRLSEKDSIIENMKKDIAFRESAKIENDSRPVQDQEWLWIGIAFFLAVFFCAFMGYWYKKRRK